MQFESQLHGSFVNVRTRDCSGSDDDSIIFTGDPVFPVFFGFFFSLRSPEEIQFPVLFGACLAAKSVCVHHGAANEASLIKVRVARPRRLDCTVCHVGYSVFSCDEAWYYDGRFAMRD